MSISVERLHRMLDSYGEVRSKLAEALDIFHDASGGLDGAGEDLTLSAVGIRDRLVEANRRMDLFLWSLEYEANTRKER